MCLLLLLWTRADPFVLAWMHSVLLVRMKVFLSMIPFVVVTVTHPVKIRAFLAYCYRVLCRLLTTHGKLYSAKPIGLRP